MGVLSEVFGDRIKLQNGGCVDVLLDEITPTEGPIEGEKRFFRTHKGPEYQTVQKPDSINRQRCFVEGRPYPCDQMPKRGLSGVAKHIRVKALRKKYGK